MELNAWISIDNQRHGEQDGKEEKDVGSVDIPAYLYMSNFRNDRSTLRVQ